MLVPFSRERLRDRSDLDDFDELAQARRDSAGDKLALALELSELSWELAEAARAAWTRSSSSLADKADFYVAPLLAVPKR